MMVHVHCQCQKVRGENNVGRNLGRQSRMGKTNGQSAHACSQNFKRVIQKAGVIIFILTRNFLLKCKKKKLKWLVVESGWGAKKRTPRVGGFLLEEEKIRILEDPL